jgi:lysophospholipase L1-like esterase
MIRGLICFGDSILAGTGASSREKGCSKLLKAWLKVPVLLKGINRQTSEDGLARMGQDVLEQKECSHVVILFGNNDCRLVSLNQSAVPQDRFMENLKTMAAQIKGSGKVPLFCNLQPIDAEKLFRAVPDFQKFQVPGVPDPEKLQATYNDLVETFARDQGECLLDIRTPLKLVRNEILAADGLHPNDEMIARKIFEELKRLDASL